MNRGFSLIEILIATLLLGVGTVAVMGLGALSTRISFENERQIVAVALATEKMEHLRLLPYSQVGIAPAGVLLATEQLTRNNNQLYTVNTTVTTLDDPATSGSNQDYKQVVVSVQWTTASNATRSVTLGSYVTPSNQISGSGSTPTPLAPVTLGLMPSPSSCIPGSLCPNNTLCTSGGVCPASDTICPLTDATSCQALYMAENNPPGGGPSQPRVLKGASTALVALPANVKSITALAVRDAGSNTQTSLTAQSNSLYVGTTNQAGVYRYYPTGNQWINEGSLGQNTAVNTFANYHGRFYAGASSKAEVYVSTTLSGGATPSTWALVGAVGDSSVTTVNALAVYNDQLYAGVGPKAQVFRYNDATATWSDVSGLLSTTGEVDSLGVRTDGTLYAGLSNGQGVWKTNSGTAWSPAGTPNASSTISALQSASTVAGNFFAAGTGAAKGVFSYGATQGWQALSDSTNALSSVTTLNDLAFYGNTLYLATGGSTSKVLSLASSTGGTYSWSTYFTGSSSSSIDKLAVDLNTCRQQDVTSCGSGTLCNGQCSAPGQVCYPTPTPTPQNPPPTFPPTTPPPPPTTSPTPTSTNIQCPPTPVCSFSGQTTASNGNVMWGEVSCAGSSSSWVSNPTVVWAYDTNGDHLVTCYDSSGSPATTTGSIVYCGDKPGTPSGGSLSLACNNLTYSSTTPTPTTTTPPPTTPPPPPPTTPPPPPPTPTPTPTPTPNTPTPTPPPTPTPTPTGGGVPTPTPTGGGGGGSCNLPCAWACSVPFAQQCDYYSDQGNSTGIGPGHYDCQLDSNDFLHPDAGTCCVQITDGCGNSTGASCSTAQNGQGFSAGGFGPASTCAPLIQ